MCSIHLSVVLYLLFKETVCNLLQRATDRGDLVCSKTTVVARMVFSELKMLAGGARVWSSMLRVVWRIGNPPM